MIRLSAFIHANAASDSQVAQYRTFSTECSAQPRLALLHLGSIDKAVRVSFGVASLVMAAAFSLCDSHSLLGCRGIA